MGYDAQKSVMTSVAFAPAHENIEGARPAGLGDFIVGNSCARGVGD